MSVEDRISQLIWKSEAETTVGVPPRGGEKPKVEPKPTELEESGEQAKEPPSE